MRNCDSFLREAINMFTNLFKPKSWNNYAIIYYEKPNAAFSIVVNSTLTFCGSGT